MKVRGFLFGVMMLAAGCGPSVVVDTSSAGTSSEGGAAGTATTSGTSNGGAGTGGAAGTAGGAGFGGFGGDIIGTGGSVPSVCAGTDFFFDISGDGPDQHYDATCQPTGWRYLGGGAKAPQDNGAPPQPPPPSGPIDLHISACPVINTVLLEISSYMDVPGTTDMASFIYNLSNNGLGKLNITEYGEVGQAIVGEYAAVVSGSTPNSPTYSLSGKFRVCREPDIGLP